MNIQLTSFEHLTLPASHPVKEQYYREQREQAAQLRTDFCVHEAMGAVCLGHVIKRPLDDALEARQVDVA